MNFYKKSVSKIEKEMKYTTNIPTGYASGSSSGNAQSKIYSTYGSYGSKDKIVAVYEGGKIYSTYGSYGSKDKIIGVIEVKMVILSLL